MTAGTTSQNSWQCQEQSQQKWCTTRAPSASKLNSLWNALLKCALGIFYCPINFDHCQQYGDVSDTELGNVAGFSWEVAWRMCFYTCLAGNTAVQQNISAGTFPTHLKPKGSMTGHPLKLSQVMYCKLHHQLLIFLFSFFTAWLSLRDVAFSCAKLLLSHHHMNLFRKIHLFSCKICSPPGCWLTKLGK